MDAPKGQALSDSEAKKMRDGYEMLKGNTKRDDEEEKKAKKAVKGNNIIIC